METWIYSNPVLTALLGILFTWRMMVLWSVLVFIFTNVPSRLFNSLLSFSIGIKVYVVEKLITKTRSIETKQIATIKAMKLDVTHG